MDDDTLDRAKGALLGLACGDALGRPVEFRSPADIDREHGTLREMVGQGTHRQPAGTVTDDTDLALCIAESLVETGRFAPDDVGRRFVDWLDAGPFDVGLTTSDAINELRSGTPALQAGETVWERLAEGGNAGNGSVMRCAPHALAFSGGRLDRVSRASSAITHFDPRCQAGCAVLNRTIRGFLDGETDPLARALETTELPGELRGALDGVREGDDEALDNSGYVVSTLQTSLHDALVADTAEAAIVTAVNRGGDADTLGAVTGAVVGARFGASALPERWVDDLRTAAGDPLADHLRGLATDLVSGEFDSAV
jgi:ADP-ribosyl-[dinitrogen reductase] hydrolase